MAADPQRELDAMKQIAGALDGLDERERERVLGWAASRFELPTALSRSAAPANDARTAVAPRDFAELYHAVDPEGDAEKALVAAYWLQEVNQVNPFDAQPLNDELKRLGYPVGNIARALGALGDGQPRLVIQVSKSGNTKQARKKYRLTAEGTRRIQSMIAEKSTQA